MRHNIMVLSFGFMFALLIVTGISYNAQAQSLGTPLGQGGAGSKGPIKIISDSLLVQQNSKTATFSGNVIATRGTVKLTSKKMIVYYEETGAAGQKKTKVKLLHAIGNVVVVSKDQRAIGNWAKMDMNSGIITMGDNVYLSQGKTKLNGSKLVVNTRTGKSQLLSGKKGGRVQGLFVPSK